MRHSQALSRLKPSPKQEQEALKKDLLELIQSSHTMVELVEVQLLEAKEARYTIKVHDYGEPIFYEPDGTDIWRENLKAWTLRHRHVEWLVKTCGGVEDLIKSRTSGYQYKGEF